MVGRLERVAVRDVWPHEALDFTRWLRDAIDVLGETIGIDLTDAECECSAGDFSVDIIAQDSDGNPIIIENQLEKSNHDHLGKLITYLTAIEAHAAVWIVADPRPDHVSAITWLNEFSPAAFYLVKVEAVQIGGSEPAPLLTLIVGPSEEAKRISEEKEKLAEGERLRQRFWVGLLERAKDLTQLHAGRPSGGTGMFVYTGVKNLMLTYGIHRRKAWVGLVIRGGHGPARQVFRELEAHASEIDTAFGQPLEWWEPDDRPNCTIGIQIVRGGYRDEEQWPEIQDEMIDAMIRLENALRPYLDKLEV